MNWESTLSSSRDSSISPDVETVRPYTMGYNDGWTKSKTLPSEFGCQSFSESGTDSRGAIAASSSDFRLAGMSLSDFHVRSYGPG